MAYTKQTWENLPSQTTPINADRLTHIEDGIFNAASTADTAASDASSAIGGLADKVDKVEGKGLSTNDFTDALKTKLDGIATGAEVNVQSDWNQSDNSADDYIKNKPSLGTSAYKNSTSVVTDSSDLVESGAVENIIGWGNKNLLPNNATSQTINGVIFTVNNDGSISTSGTAASDWIIFDIGNVTLKSGTYKFNGCNGGSVNTYRMTLTKTGSDVTTLYDGENEFTLEEDTEVTAKIIVRYVNVNMNDKVFYPMISKNGGAYEPYHASVEETMRDAQFIQGKNYLPNDITTQTVNGITFAVQEDGTVIANGTASADWARVYFANNTYLPVGNYLLSGVTGGATTTYRITLEMSDGTSVTVFDGDTAFTITEGKYINKAAILIRQAGYVANNVVFKPMVRKATESDPTYEPYYVPLKDVVPTKADNSVIGTVEDGTNPTKSYAVNEFMVRDGAFCQVTAPVTTSSTWTEGSNYTKKSIAEVLQSLMS